jgi:hypothetical protein
VNAPRFEIGWTQLVDGDYRGTITLWLECDGGTPACTQVHGWGLNDPAPLDEIERAKALHLAEAHGGLVVPKPLPGELWTDLDGDEWLVTSERWLSRPVDDVDMTGWRLAAEADHREAGTKIVARVDHGHRTVEGTEVEVWELTWNGGGRSFEVIRVSDGKDLTEQGAFDTLPTDEQIADLLTAADE